MPRHSRHAISVAATLSPVLRFYQVILYPVAKPTSFVLDRWLGEEAVSYYRERDVQELIKLHMQSSDTEIDRVEGRGAINFLDLDDLTIEHEGEIIDPRSILQINFEMGKPVIPEIDPSDPDGFFQSVLLSQKKWVILTDQHHEPRLVLNADRFIREALLKPDKLNFLFHCHRPILIRDGSVTLDQVIPRFSVNPQHSQDDVIDEDIIILWSHQKKIITGSDLLGRLLRGIVQNRAFTIESSHAAEDPTSNEK
jgi:metal transporter CNNM